jgi:YaiO family outer membrane protein
MTRSLRSAVVVGLVLSALSSVASADSSRDALMATATRLGYDNRAEAGLAVVRQVLAQHPDDVEARILEARLLAWSGRNDDAGQAVSRLQEEHPANADILALAGDIAWYGGDIATAHERYQGALSLTPDHSDSLQGLARTEAARKRHWRIDSGLDVSRFGPQGLKEWQDSSLRIGYAPSDDTEIHVVGWQSHRFSLIDRYVEIGADQRFLPWLRGSAAVGMTPDGDFLPKRRFALGSAVRVRDDKGLLDATWLSLDWQRSAYRSGTVSYIAPGLQQYLFEGRVWTTARVLRVVDENGKSNLGYETRADWQVLDQFRIFIGYSDAPETNANITAYTSSRFGGVVVGLTPDIDVTLSASRGDPWRKTVGAALSVRF